MDNQYIHKYNPYLYIWGAQWITSALLIYIWNLEHNHIALTITVWAAALLTLLVFVLGLKQRSKHESGQRSTPSSLPSRSNHPFMWVIPICYLIASAGLFMQAADQGYFLFDLLRALVLGFIYTVLGVRLGRELIYLGIWLLALTAILTIWYLGFAPLVLMFFGGWSLVACAVILRIWSRAATNTAIPRTFSK
jgi:hypothetical protein